MVDYPKQIFCVWSGKAGHNSSLSATYELVAPLEEKATSPLQLHEPRLSRFAVTLLDGSSGTTIPLLANIPATDIPAIAKKTDIAMILKAQNAFSQKETESDVEACYTEEIRFGKFKGKTPAAVLLEDTSAVNDLKSTANWLKEQLAKYPNNKTQVDAIEQAITLLDIGELRTVEVKTPAASSSSLQIYKKDYKYTRRKNEKGHFLCYNILITCHFGMTYPWLVTVENYYAPMVDGTINYKQTSDKKRATMRLTDEDWLNCVNQFTELKRLHESTNFYSLLQRANDLAKQQADEARARKMDSNS